MDCYCSTAMRGPTILKAITVLLMALALAGCRTTRGVIVWHGDRIVIVHESGWCYLPGEWRTVIDDQTATDTRTKSALESIIIGGIAAAPTIMK